MIPLVRASMCLDEEVIFDRTAGQGCPRCGSRQVIALSCWLNRPAPARITVGPLELLALAEQHGLDVGPEAWK